MTFSRIEAFQVKLLLTERKPLVWRSKCAGVSESWIGLPEEDAADHWIDWNRVLICAIRPGHIRLVGHHADVERVGLRLQQPASVILRPVKLRLGATEAADNIDETAASGRTATVDVSSFLGL